MPAFSSSDRQTLSQAERDVAAKLNGREVDFESLGIVSNVFRVANKARYHFERSVLGPHDISFTAFTALWVLWIWGSHEARHLAEETGVTKGTLTGVVDTLVSKGLVERSPHPSDGRLVLISTTSTGESLMATLFPLINASETEITSTLSPDQKHRLADDLRTVLARLNQI